jgi:RNA polymerase subunit RPABC4/transcription elongation factor Spt4
MSIRVYGRSCDRCGRITTAVEDDRLCRRCAADELRGTDRQ